MKSAGIALLLLLASCAPIPAAPPTTDLLSAQEALFRHQITRVAPAGSDFSTICVSTQGFQPQSDPPPELIARLSNVNPPVKPWSSCRWSDARPVDSATGRPAVQVAHALQCSDTDHCGGPGGYAYGNVGAEYFDYALERRNGRWIVSENATVMS
ncbi:MAG: hypothetical protein ACR2JJ_11465 [Sphingomicrobium sp.]